jgi:hypothetical protein
LATEDSLIAPIKILIAHGVDAPERLLFASESDLRKIKGLGRAGFEEVMRYRTRFIPLGDEPVGGL